MTAHPAPTQPDRHPSDRHPSDRNPSDQDLDNSIARMLAIGVSLAALIVLAGGVLLLRHPQVPAPSFTQFHAGGPALSTLTGIVHAAFAGRPGSIIQLGLLILIATPVARVVFCVVGFARQRDLLYVLTSLTVLAVLLYSLTRGAH